MTFVHQVPSRAQKFHIYLSFVGSLHLSITGPTKVEEAFMESKWIQAMQDELHQFELNNVWEFVKRPDPRKHNIIGTKWIYRNNQDETGRVVRNKARLIALGYTG